MAKDAFAAVTPGEMLKEEFLAEYGLSQNQLAKTIGISPNRIAEIVNNCDPSQSHIKVLGARRQITLNMFAGCLQVACALVHERTHALIRRQCCNLR